MTGESGFTHHRSDVILFCKVMIRRHEHGEDVADQTLAYLDENGHQLTECELNFVLGKLDLLEEYTAKLSPVSAFV